MGKESEISEQVRFYSFYPYLYGPFSSQLNLDIADLQSRAFLDEKLDLKISEEETSRMVNRKTIEIVDNLLARRMGENIVSYVYGTYPEYTSRSRLRRHPQTKKEPGIFSIGYEGHNIDSFLDLLIQNEIETVADLRHNPFSMNMVFTKSRLSGYLGKIGINYLHIPELGIDGRYRKNLNDDEDYQKLFAFYSSEILPKQEDKVKRIVEMGKTNRVAMLCFEHDKDHCHRGVVSKELEKDSVMVKHL
jgi:uncharacterized protein (DUF488 family)